MSYGTGLTADIPFADAVSRVRAALHGVNPGSQRPAMDGTASGAGGAALQVSFRTTCGRELRIGRLVLGGGHHPARRVSLGISAAADTGDGTWAGLTAGEARRLAAALLVQAAACDALPPKPEDGPVRR